MSKIGRKPISIKDMTVEIDGNVIRYQGKKAQGEYILPPELKLEKQVGDFVKITPNITDSTTNRKWGLHRALLANYLQGASIGFEEHLQIVGLGYKAAITGKKAIFSLGFSHKIDFTIPEDVVVEADAKTGQQLVVKGINKERVGLISDQIRSLRPPEPYKGTGIKLKRETILRKAGKTKNA